MFGFNGKYTWGRMPATLRDKYTISFIQVGLFPFIEAIMVTMLHNKSTSDIYIQYIQNTEHVQVQL